MSAKIRTNTGMYRTIGGGNSFNPMNAQCCIDNMHGDCCQDLCCGEVSHPCCHYSGGAIAGYGGHGRKHTNRLNSRIKPWPMNQPMWTVADCVEANHPGQLDSLCKRMASDSHLAIV